MISRGTSAGPSQSRLHSVHVLVVAQLPQSSFPHLPPQLPSWPKKTSRPGSVELSKVRITSISAIVALLEGRALTGVLTENNLFLVKRLIQRTDMRNPDPSTRRYTSLAWAAVLGHEETFDFLLNEGHDDEELSKARISPSMRIENASANISSGLYRMRTTILS